jgi:NAD+ synthase (glutamine-hydrolysing)
VADMVTNCKHTQAAYARAVQQDVSLVVFPELSITGYTLGDLVQQNQLLEHALEGCLALAKSTQDQPTAMIVGLPLQVSGRLYNCAAVLAGGQICGIVPKTHRPTYSEFYEQRWYERWEGGNIQIEMGGTMVPFGTKLLFLVGGVPCGVELCEDLWVLQPPSQELARTGAVVIANPSASPEQIGRAAYRRQLVAVQSAKMFGAYLYAGCHTSESTAEVVMGGHQLIAVNGVIAAERLPFNGAGSAGNTPAADTLLSIADVDIDHLVFDRRRQHAPAAAGSTVIDTGIRRQQTNLYTQPDPHPFTPAEPVAARTERLETALNIQAQGLAMRLQATKQHRVVLGLSGGLDSTLALLVVLRAAAVLGHKPSEAIYTLTMPGPASSDATQQTAQDLAQTLGVHNSVIPITNLVQQELDALGHDGITQDITYENVQARARTSLLFNYANQHHAIVLGTGDMSELALGWCTYNGDQQSHYNVNASIPKTLVRTLVEYTAGLPAYQKAAPHLRTVLDTVVSPELTTTNVGEGSGSSGNSTTHRPGNHVSQSTESLIGPYELHDFFLYNLVRWGDKPAKIAYLAQQAFADTYDATQIDKWLTVFVQRFAASQFKRETMPNGPKVGAVSLSPRGDWRMPPDLWGAPLWQ